MSYPLQQPDPPAVFKVAEFIGDVAIFLIGGYHETLATEKFTSPAARVTVVMLTGRTAGKVYEDAILWGQRQTSQFQDKQPGSAVLCRITKNGNAYTFEPGSSYDAELANNWIAANALRFDQLRMDAVKHFNRACADLAQQGIRQSPAPQASPQWTPPKEEPAKPNATMQTLTDPAEPATEEEAGY
jgi:hypothetical protein